MKSLTAIVDVNCLLSFWDMLFKGVDFSHPGRKYGVNQYSTYSTLLYLLFRTVIVIVVVVDTVIVIVSSL